MNPTCPVCKLAFDLVKARADTGRSPIAGDLHVCFRCGEVLVFNPDISLDQASLNDILNLSKSERDLLGKYQREARCNREIRMDKGQQV